MRSQLIEVKEAQGNGYWAIAKRSVGIAYPWDRN